MKKKLQNIWKLIHYVLSLYQQNNKTMSYADIKFTESQIQRAKAAFTKWYRYETAQDNSPEVVGMNQAEQRADFHNRIIDQIAAGNREVEKEHKMFFLMEEFKKDQKEQQSKDKKAANKAASADVLAPIKELRKLGEFGNWLNTSGNPFRKQHFNKKYTVESVNAFLSTL